MRLFPARSQSDDIRSSFIGAVDHREAYCGHKIDIHRPPHANCEQCWSFFFMSNVEFTRSMGELLAKVGGEAAIISVHGAKFAKKLKWFFMAVAKAKEVSDLINQQIEAEELQNVEYDLVIPSGAKGSAVTSVAANEEVSA